MPSHFRKCFQISALQLAISPFKKQVELIAVVAGGLASRPVGSDTVGHSNQKVPAVLGIAHYEEQGCLAVSEGIQFQLIIGGQVPDLLNVKNKGSGRRTDKDAFGCLTRNELSRTF